MFEITDEFLAQAGFSALRDDQKITLKEQVANSVQQKIGERIANTVGEARAEELAELMEGDAQYAHSVVSSFDGAYQESDEFKAVQELGAANGASTDDIIKEFAVAAWLRQHEVNLAAVTQEAMDEAMVELSTFYQQAANITQG